MTHQDYVEGYMDGYDLDCPEPGANQSPRYKHSFNIGRLEKTGQFDKLPNYHQSLARVAIIEANLAT